MTINQINNSRPKVALNNGDIGLLTKLITCIEKVQLIHAVLTTVEAIQRVDQRTTVEVDDLESSINKINVNIQKMKITLNDENLNLLELLTAYALKVQLVKVALTNNKEKQQSYQQAQAQVTDLEGQIETNNKEITNSEAHVVSIKQQLEMEQSTTLEDAQTKLAILNDKKVELNIQLDEARLKVLELNKAVVEATTTVDAAWEHLKKAEKQEPASQAQLNQYEKECHSIFSDVLTSDELKDLFYEFCLVELDDKKEEIVGKQTIDWVKISDQAQKLIAEHEASLRAGPNGISSPKKSLALIPR